MRVDLPYPHKLLWPNGSRGNPRAVAGQNRTHKSWAYYAAKASPAPVVGDGSIPIKLIVHAKPRGPLPDRDNCVAALKTYQDGIAAALGINDKHFAAPTVEFSPDRSGRFVIEVGHG
jgi:crossover junction endodeoxyribonuclease RusA